MQPLVKTTGLFMFFVLSSSIYALDVEGKWVSACFQIEHGYERDTLSFNGNNVALKMEVAQGKNCKSVMDVVVTTSYHIGPSAQSTPAANEMDMILTTATMTPRSGLVAGYLNSTKLCGFSNWKANESKDVQGLNCGDKTLPKTGDSIYDLIQVQGNTMLRGKYTVDLDGSSIEKRPVQLNAEQAFLKQ